MSDKTVLITGSSKGLGASLALVFARNRYDVILHGRDKDRLATMEAGVLVRGQFCDVVRGDITSEKTINQLYRVGAKRDVNILINNAGIYSGKPFQEMGYIEARDVLDVNLNAPIQLIKKFFPFFLKKKSGLIININSMAGKIPNELEAAYCASKFGLRGFMDSLQNEANRNGVRIINVYPGAMRTPMTEDRPDQPKLIATSEAADLIFRISREYESLRITEIHLSRRRY